MKPPRALPFRHDAPPDQRSGPDGRAPVPGLDAPPVTSPANARIKTLRALRERRGRAEAGLMLAEGEEALRMALDAGRAVRGLVVDPARAGEGLRDLVARGAAAGAEVIPASAAVLAALSGRDNPPRVVAVLPQTWTTIEDLVPAPRAGFVAPAARVDAVAPVARVDAVAPVTRVDAVAPVARVDSVAPVARANSAMPAARMSFVVLEAPRDPRNLGAVARSAEAAGMRGLILLGESCDPWGPDALAASAGALLVLPVARAGLAEFEAWRARHGVLLVGTSLGATLDYRAAVRGGTGAVPVAVPVAGAVAVAMGTEATGLSAELEAACDRLVKIPMRGRVDSLNLAVAAGLMIYAVTDALAADGMPEG